MQPQHRTPGRAATSNPDNRFDRFTNQAVDDGWGHTDELPVLRTSVRDETPRKVITRNTSPDLSFDRSINPYRGCEHGCIYCYARPSHAYLGLSPGLDFETQLIARPDAPDILRAELSKPSYVPYTIAIGTNTDELLSNLLFEGCLSCGDLAVVGGFNSVFERDACDDFGQVIKAA